MNHLTGTSVVCDHKAYDTNRLCPDKQFTRNVVSRNFSSRDKVSDILPCEINIYPARILPV